MNEEMSMSERAILVRDRQTGAMRPRLGSEPAKLRVCRTCGRVTSGPCAGCAAE